MSLNGRTIALAAGGTGGHMFPAEALAQELRRRRARIVLATDARGLRYTDRFPADELFEISAASPSIGGPAAKAAAAISIAGGFVTALRELRRLGVEAAVGFGGYPSLPAMKAAAVLRIPYGVHEQNGVLGRANRMLVRGAAFTAHAFPALDKAPTGLMTQVEVGNPVRDAVRAAARGFEAPGADGPLRVLVFGGSQGASLFSRVVPAAIARLDEGLRRRLDIVQQAREDDLAAVEEAYRAAGVRIEAAPFFDDLPQRMADAHLVIARSGASTVTELSIIGRPSVLVPLAIAMDDHQYGNARALGDVGGAEIIREVDFSEEALSEALAGLLADPVRLAAMAEAARGRVKSGAAARLADLVGGMLAEPRKQNRNAA